MVYDAIYARGKKAGEAEKVQLILNDPVKARDAFEQHVMQNPEGRRFVRAPPTDWSQYEQVTGTESRQAVAADDVPMTKHQFMKYAVDSLGPRQVWWGSILVRFGGQPRPQNGLRG